MKNTRATQIHFAYLTLFLFLPFAGLVLAKRSIPVYICLLIWSLIIFSCTALGLIGTLLGFSLFLLSILGLHIAGICNISFIMFSRRLQSWRNLRHAAAFSVAFSLYLLSLFFYRSTFLGIDLFYIPSESMQPTLMPGDIVLVDTRHYQTSKPKKAEIVVFYRIEGKLTYVKRVAEVFENDITVAGDNPSSSASSKSIGKIPFDRLRGKVTAVIWNTHAPAFHHPRAWIAVPPLE